jgi:hypothetical protein
MKRRQIAGDAHVAAARSYTSLFDNDSSVAIYGVVDASIMFRPVALLSRVTIDVHAT